MKKILMFFMNLIVILLCVIVFCNNKTAKAATLNTDYNTFGLGTSINIALDTYFDYDNINAAESIFDSTWITNNTSVNDVRKSYTRTASGKNIEEFAQDYSIKLGINIDMEEEFLGLLNSSINQTISFADELDRKDYKYQYFYNLYSYHQKYYANLGNINDLTNYQNNLSQNYKGYLNLLFRNAITPQIFFNKFGTHVLVSGIYGGRLDYTYVAYNNQVEINNDLKAKIDFNIKSKIDSVMESGSNYNFDFGSTIGYSQATYEEKSHIISRGGNSFSIASMGDFSNNYTNWCNNLNEYNASLIEISQNGLVPLWNLLPNYYTEAQKNWFKQQCLIYINNNATGLISPEFAPDLGPTYSSGPVVVRSEAVVITDDDINFNHCDTIDLNFLTSYGCSVLNKDLEYTKMDITLTLDVELINKGYQDIYIYLDDKKILEYSNSMDKEDGKVKRLTIDYCHLDLNDVLKDSKLYIKYSAHGVLEDDWYCKNVTISITYLK